MHVLIIDDHAFVCAGLKVTLTEEFKQIEVSTSNHGELALDILASAVIDMVIVDLFMPGGAGGFNF
ncbi:MAG: DNA-binding NarL/FixJ family response regulator, partial [Porticoccaceae bacterium]